MDTVDAATDREDSRDELKDAKGTVRGRVMRMRKGGTGRRRMRGWGVKYGRAAG